MPFPDFNDWLLFTVFFSLLLLVTFIMMKQSQQFYTKDPIVRKFSILELELPASAKELVNLITGLYKLSPPDSQKSIRALKGQLQLDFLFMPLAYGSIFLLCWRVAHKMSHFGYGVFISLAVLQVLPWIFDIIENVYLLKKINPNVQETDERKHKRYLQLEAFKWGIPLTATVCSISAVCYFWLTGAYSKTSLLYLLACIVEIIIFLVIVKFALSAKNKPVPV